jgi:hypothetical protein
MLPSFVTVWSPTMMAFNTPGSENPSDQLAILHGILERFAQAKHAADFAIIKQLLLERIAELEEEVADIPPADSRP